MNFTLYFAIPVFNELMNDEYFEHLLLLIISLEYLLKKKIDRAILFTINRMLTSFVGNLEKLYDQHIMLSGVHELLHLVQCTEELGPLNCLGCFQYEENNRKITGSIKSQDLVGDEYIKRWSVSRSMALIVNNLDHSNNKVANFIKENFHIKSSNLKRNKKSCLRFSSKIDNIKSISFEIINLIKELNIDLNECNFYENIYINEILYSCINDKTKFNNSTISHNELIGQVCCIINYNNNTYIICREIKELEQPFFNKQYREIKSHIKRCIYYNSYFTILQHDFKSLKKHFLYRYTDRFCFISTYISDHLFS
jgi:hypothetical protein